MNEYGRAPRAGAKPVRIQVQCPACGECLGRPVEEATVCLRGGFKVKKAGGIYRAVYFAKTLLKIAAEPTGGADILDVGAGNGWSNYGLALKEHHPIALDRVDKPDDGLRAAQQYFSCPLQSSPRFQPEMDRLPFANRQYDTGFTIPSTTRSRGPRRCTVRGTW